MVWISRRLSAIFRPGLIRQISTEKCKRQHFAGGEHGGSTLSRVKGAADRRGYVCDEFHGARYADGTACPGCEGTDFTVYPENPQPAQRPWHLNGSGTGSSGDYLSVADTVLQMDCYHALDVTEKAQSLAQPLTEDEVRRYEEAGALCAHIVEASARRRNPA